MSGDEQPIAGERQTLFDDAAMDERLKGEPEERLARLRRVALPAAQQKAGRRRPRGVPSAIVRVLAGVGLYCIPALALCVALGALGYSIWVVADIARSAGSLDLTRVEDAFGQIDIAARAFMASVAYALLIVTLYLLAAALRAGETWTPLLVTLIIATPSVLLFTLCAELAFSLAPADTLPTWGRDVIEAAVLCHAIFLAVLLRVRRPVAQALDNLAFTRRHNAGILYAGALPRLHVIRFSAGDQPIASAPPQPLDPPAVESPAGPAETKVETALVEAAADEEGAPLEMTGADLPDHDMSGARQDLASR